MKVLVVGAGRVGLIMAVALARLGHEVVCLEKDAERVELLRQGCLPFRETGLAEALRAGLEAGRLVFLHAGGPYAVAPGTQVVMLCVGTPSTPVGGIDLSQLEAAVEFLLPRLEQHVPPAGSGPAVLVTKSTVPVGTARALAARVAARGMAGRVLVASNPEFLREGTALDDALHPDRIVVGVREPEAAAILGELYAGIDAPVIVTDWQTAELIKYAANAFLATRLSLVNELADLAEATGADIVEVARGIGLDPRIGPHYLKAGLGYGGSCLPKDVAGLIHMASEQGVAPVLLTAVAAVNALRPGKVVARLRQALGGSLAGRVVAVLGLSFKGGTDDLRSSPALAVVRLLAKAGARVRAYDPAHAPAHPDHGQVPAPPSAGPARAAAAAASVAAGVAAGVRAEAGVEAEVGTGPGAGPRAEATAGTATAARAGADAAAAARAGADAAAGAATGAGVPATAGAGAGAEAGAGAGAEAGAGAGAATATGLGPGAPEARAEARAGTGAQAEARAGAAAATGAEPPATARAGAAAEAGARAATGSLSPRDAPLPDLDPGLDPINSVSVEILPSAYEAVRGAEAVAVVTDWDEFTQLDWERMRKVMAGRVVLDARLCLDAAHLSKLGFFYIAPGRGQFPVFPGVEGGSRG